jgi:hypothetical protein
MTFELNPFLVDPLLMGTKKTVMVPWEVKPGTRIHLQQSKSHIASAVSAASRRVLIKPSKRRIYKQRGTGWEAFDSRMVKTIIIDEGFSDISEFWKTQPRPRQLNIVYLKDINLTQSSN